MTLQTTYAAVLGSKLKELRIEKGYDQAKMAEAIGVTRTSWSRIENGITAVTLHQLDNICDVLGVDSLVLQRDTREAVKRLERAGVSVHRKTEKQLDPQDRSSAASLGLAALGGVALATVLGLVLSDSEDKNDSGGSDKSES